jgi:hypothetical protein
LWPGGRWRRKADVVIGEGEFRFVERTRVEVGEEDNYR